MRQTQLQITIPAPGADDDYAQLLAPFQVIFSLVREASVVKPVLRVIEAITARRESCSPWCSNNNRTTCTHVSCENLVDLSILSLYGVFGNAGALNWVNRPIRVIKTGLLEPAFVLAGINKAMFIRAARNTHNYVLRHCNLS